VIPLQEFLMVATDSFSVRYQDLLDGSYDCVDRIVFNGYCALLCSPGGFRTWWREVYGNDDHLDDAHVMRWAGRFARRVRAMAKKRKIPIVEKVSDERMHPVAEQHRPSDVNQKGLFCITIHRAPNSVWGVKATASGSPHLARKSPPVWVNHFAFHFQDPDWGHVTFKICPHPPFSVQVTLNGHEYVARQALRRAIPFTKEGNCFTGTTRLADLDQVAETLRSESAVGPLRKVCERWFSSAVLCYLLPVAQQQALDMRYEWSVYQLEYSRNLLFSKGRIMEEIFQSVIDRTRRVLDVGTVRTLFGRKKRPKSRRGHKAPRFEVVVERPTYDLIVFKVHCRLLTLKIYTKGDRVLRIEAIVHNAKKEFAKGYGVDHFAEIAEALRSLVERFLEVLRSVEACWVSDETLERLPERSQVGAAKVAGLDLNCWRMRAVMMAVLALSAGVRGFRAEQLAERVAQMLGTSYTPRQAAYDLKKLRGKGLIEKIEGTRRYLSSADGLRTIMAVVVLREKVIKPILAGTVSRRHGRPPKNRDSLDQHYQIIRDEIEKILQELNIAA
jgi:DNA-binding transcriptional ArsR family regulator